MTSRGTKRKSISNDDDVSSVSTVGSKSKRRTTSRASNSDGQNDSIASQRQNAREWAIRNLNMSSTFKSQVVQNEGSVTSPGLQMRTTAKPISPEIAKIHATTHIITGKPAPITAVGNKTKINRKLNVEAEEPARRNSLQDRILKADLIVKSPSVPSHSLENKRTARPSEVSALNGRVPSIVASHIAGPFTRRADSQREANSVIADIPLVAHRYSVTEPRQKASEWPTGDLNLPSPVISPTHGYVVPGKDEAGADNPTLRVLSPGVIDQPSKTDAIKDSTTTVEVATPATSSVESMYAPSLAVVRDRVLAPLVVALLLTAMLRSSDSRALAIGGIISALACSALRRLVLGMVNFLSSIFSHGSWRDGE